MDNIFNSKRITSPYVNSSPWPDAWGQPPASYYSIVIEKGIIKGQLVAGYYVSNEEIMPGDEAEIGDELLRNELSSWESAGYQDWIAFENLMEEDE